MSSNFILFYRIPSNTDVHLKSFLRGVFEKDVAYRPSAEECLKLDFFEKYIIPQTIPDDIFYQPYDAQEILKEPSSIGNGILCLLHREKNSNSSKRFFFLLCSQLTFPCIHKELIQLWLSSIRYFVYKRSQQSHICLKMQTICMC